MKIISMYLPQFHRTPENDEWWGEGFTEWTAVKSATPLFENHKMPRIPLNNNYYNLIQKETMEWQAGLMHKYGIDGMCFYHYYFRNGRKILEKPAENLLNWKDIDMPFCFSWANETWARSWSKLNSKNVWAPDSEFKKDDDGILLEQAYGDKKEWKKHFGYLLQFFKDERYIKYDNKPVFLIYKADEIHCLSDMLNVWQIEAKKNGLNGIYTISTNTVNSSCDASLNMEPQYSFFRFHQTKYQKTSENVSTKIDYKEIVSQSCLIQDEMPRNRKIYFSVFPNYDDTPRRGTAGRAVVDSTPELFQKYMLNTIKNSIRRENEFLFINAWNEWGETMYVEPDTEWKDGYLQSIQNAVEESKVTVNKSFEINNKDDDTTTIVEGLEKTINQYRSYWKLFDKWMMLKEMNIPLDKYFHKNDIEHIAIYGFGIIGNHFVTEMEKSDVIIDFGVDGKGKSLIEKFPIYTLNEPLPSAEMIVVTVTYDYDSIRAKLEEKGLRNVISLETIIGNLMEDK